MDSREGSDGSRDGAERHGCPEGFCGQGLFCGSATALRGSKKKAPRAVAAARREAGQRAACLHVACRVAGLAWALSLATRPPACPPPAPRATRAPPQPGACHAQPGGPAGDGARRSGEAVSMERTQAEAGCRGPTHPPLCPAACILHAVRLQPLPWSPGRRAGALCWAGTRP